MDEASEASMSPEEIATLIRQLDEAERERLRMLLPEGIGGDRRSARDQEQQEGTGSPSEWNNRDRDHDPYNDPDRLLDDGRAHDASPFRSGSLNNFHSRFPEVAHIRLGGSEDNSHRRRRPIATGLAYDQQSPTTRSADASFAQRFPGTARIKVS
jgi:hypothetical protein